MTEQPTTVESMARRLRSVTPPVVIDPPCPDTLSDEWTAGWQACRETLGREWEAAYERGFNAKPIQSVGLGFCVLLCAAFILGFFVAVALLA